MKAHKQFGTSYGGGGGGVFGDKKMMSFNYRTVLLNCCLQMVVYGIYSKYVNNMMKRAHDFDIQVKIYSKSSPFRPEKLKIPVTSASLSIPSKSACSIAITPLSANNCSG